MSVSNSETKIWKERYQTILKDLEAKEAEYKNNREVFTRALTRLSLASKGLDTRLDPHLLYLRKELKYNEDDKEFANIVGKFSDKLLHYEDDSDEEYLQDAGLLFDFLISKENNKNKIRAFILLREQYEMGELSGASELIKLVTVLSLRDEGGDDAGESTLTGANLEISNQLIELLEGDDVKGISSEQAEHVINMLQNDHVGNFYENIGAALVLLQSIKKQEIVEKKAMDSFLNNVTQKLVILSKNTKGATKSIGNVTHKRDDLDKGVSEHIESIQQHINKETTLDVLKSLVRSELDHIGQKIKVHQKEIEKDQSETDKQLALMSSEVELMRTKTENLKANLKLITKQALTDALTQLPNRLAYDQRFANDFARWERYREPLCLLVWDIDFFKNINDEYGHKAGDKVLMMIARVLQKYCRETDFVARFGGEEFVMLLPNTDSKSALIMANKIRQIIEKIGFNYSGKSIRITICCGITEVMDDDTHEALFERADKGLYKAKDYGRNQCVII